MKLYTVVAFALVTVCSSALPLAQTIVGDAPQYTWCNSSLSYLVVDGIATNPATIHRDESVQLMINATVASGQRVDGGSVSVKVKAGFFVIYNEKFDLCDELAQANYSCPLRSGFYDVTKKLKIPKEADGNFAVDLRATDDAGVELLCLQIDVNLAKRNKRLRKN